MKKLLFAFLVFAAPAHAQQQSQSANEQVLGNKLVKEIQESLACQSSLITLQQQLNAANDKIKELENPKKDEKKK